MRRPPPWTSFLKYPITAGTILLAVAVSLAYWSGKIDVTPLFETVDIRRGQLWRLLSSALPHANFFHLLFNAYWTWAFGTLIEERFGHFKTLALFAFLAILSNGAEYAFLDGGIGLSGIMYGLFGLLWILARRDPKFADAIDPKTVKLFIGWFFFCIILTVSNIVPIANVAHGVGAISGALVGLALAAPPHQRRAAVAALLGLFAAMLLADTVARPFINLSKYRGYAEGKLGYDALIANDNTAALRWSRDATRMQPEMAIYWSYVAMANDRLGRHAEALTAYQRAHQLEPDNSDFQIPSEAKATDRETTAPASRPFP